MCIILYYGKIWYYSYLHLIIQINLYNLYNSYNNGIYLIIILMCDNTYKLEGQLYNIIKLTNLKEIYIKRIFDILINIDYIRKNRH